MIPLDENIPAPPTKEQLVDQLKDVVKTLVTDEVEADGGQEAIWILRQIYKASQYWRGLQYSVPQLFNGWIDFSASGSPIAGPDRREEDSSGLYDYVMNVYRGYGRKFTAVLGQRSPNVKAEADDPSNEKAKSSTRMADNAAQILRAKWDVDVRQLELAMYLWKNGTAFAYTPYVADKRKYGQSSEPTMEAREVPLGPPTFSCTQCGQTTPADQVDQTLPGCPNCGKSFAPEDYQDSPTAQMPVITGTASYDNGGVELELLHWMFVRVPTFEKDLDGCSWLSYDYDTHKGKLIQRYPKLRDKVLDHQGGDSASSGSAQLTRDASASPTGVAVPHRGTRWNYRRVWLQPEMYECVVDPIKRQSLLDNFPNGCKVTMVQGQVMELENEDLRDVWAMCKPETSEYTYCDGIGYDMMPAQDLINDCGVNLPAETIERGLGITMADPRVIDVDQWSQRSAKAAELIPAMPAVGTSLGDSFFQLPPTSFSAQIGPWVQSMEEMAKRNCGTVDPIFGGGNDAPTARQAEISKNAALMQLGTTWLFCRKFWERVYLNGVKQLAKWGSGTIRYKDMVVDLAELEEEGYHFEADEAMPMTWSQQRDFVMWLMEKPPQLLHAYGVDHPMNVQRNQALLGMAGYYTPGVDQFEKTMEIIQQLSQAAPVQQQQPDGSTDVQPSIPADEFEDDHGLCVQIVQAWSLMISARRLRESNLDGYTNVIAWGKAHAKLAQPPPPPPPPPKLSLSAKLPVDPQQATQILQQQGVNVADPLPPVTNAHGQLPLPQGPPMGPPIGPGAQLPSLPGTNGAAPQGPPPEPPGGPMLPAGGPPPPGAQPGMSNLSQA